MSRIASPAGTLSPRESTTSRVFPLPCIGGNLVVERKYTPAQLVDAHLFQDQCYLVLRFRNISLLLHVLRSRVVKRISEIEMAL